MIKDLINKSQLCRMAENFELPICVVKGPNYELEFNGSKFQGRLKTEFCKIQYCNKEFCSTLALSKNALIGLPIGALDKLKAKKKLGFAHVLSLRLPQYGEAKICSLIIWSCSEAYSLQRFTEHILSCCLSSAAKDWFPILRPDSFSKGERINEIMRLTAMGFTSKEIGYFLKIAANTVAQVKWRQARKCELT